MLGVMPDERREQQDAARLARRTVAAVKPGSIVVMHMNHNGVHTAEALPQVIAELRKRGYRFVQVGSFIKTPGEKIP